MKKIMYTSLISLSILLSTPSAQAGGTQWVDQYSFFSPEGQLMLVQRCEAVIFWHYECPIGRYRTIGSGAF